MVPFLDGSRKKSFFTAEYAEHAEKANGPIVGQKDI